MELKLFNFLILGVFPLSFLHFFLQVMYDVGIVGWGSPRNIILLQSYLSLNFNFSCKNCLVLKLYNLFYSCLVLHLFLIRNRCDGLPWLSFSLCFFIKILFKIGPNYGVFQVRISTIPHLKWNVHSLCASTLLAQWTLVWGGVLEHI